MKILLPSKPAAILWSKGDIIVFDSKAFLVSDLGATDYVGLVELENGMSWFGNREVTVASLQKIVTNEKHVTAHYPKTDYEIELREVDIF